MEIDVAATPPPKPTVNSDSQTQDVSSSSSPLPLSLLRQWRQHAQRNMRNQWSKLASYRQQWASSSSSGRSHATSLVNAHLNRRYITSMELGILSEMPAIQARASQKLFKQQELHQRKLVLSYKEMLGVVTHMVNAAKSMRSFLRGGSSSPIMQFSSTSGDMNDTGDGGGIPLFAFLSISSLEQLAEELVQMFKFELALKRLIVVALLVINSEAPQGNELCWSDELYAGEFKDLIICNLYSKETSEPPFPRLKGSKSNVPDVRCTSLPNDQTLQNYITTWLAEVNLDMQRRKRVKI
ncbi:hypothetical protein HS088_TW13G01330 [Tripterygium wilfordii]|uniref:Uncharacterized protein n=1 Tax=Tripterygium wilfordii TaxID=458696 RepID=A0A7J7CWG5_TRIWF|nr:hypothetical protein HS088_TW13G01330 [Tripterygium wilfordii]